MDLQYVQLKTPSVLTAQDAIKKKYPLRVKDYAALHGKIFMNYSLTRAHEHPSALIMSFNIRHCHNILFSFLDHKVHDGYVV